ncbi:MAG: anthranilate synthase component I family protein [Nannocystaceae bacterium]
MTEETADLAAALLELAARAPAGRFAWLDGGAQRGFCGIDVDLEIAEDDLAGLERVERAWRADPTRIWIGWITYELGVDALLGRPPRRGALPGLCLRRYRGALELDGGGVQGHGEAAAVERLRAALASARPRSAPLDPRRARAEELSQERDTIAATSERARATWQSDRDGPPSSRSEQLDAGAARASAGGLASWPLERLETRIEPNDYRARIRRAKESIAAGDTYQVNLSQPFTARWRPDAVAGLARRAAAIYGHLRASTPASMGALLDVGGAWIASNSPETLVDVRLGTGIPDRARSWPIKGTRPRGGDAAEDQARRVELMSCPKERAEHVMIVDLVRNDLGRVALAGTVTAPRRPTLVTLPTVHHLVSEVSCALRPGWSLRQLVDALFPGGSITGAPKRRTIEIIEALEERPRGIYCGALLVLEPGGLRLSIPIRTALIDDAGLLARGGGGVVADSDPEAERRETITKLRAFDRCPMGQVQPARENSIGARAHDVR